MNIASVTQEREWLDVFEAAAALYSTLKDNQGSFKIRRAEIKQDGEIIPDPIDFCIDFELKASRALPWMEYQTSLRIIAANNAEILSPEIKLVLGRMFTECNMGVDGAYRKLYHVTKNDQVRSAMRGTNNGTN